MNKIEKKVTPEYFDAVLSGNKTFEVRLADWRCDVGDVLVLKEWDSHKKLYTGRQVEKKVSFIFKTKDMEKFFSKEEIDKYGFQVLALKDI